MNTPFLILDRSLKAVITGIFLLFIVQSQAVSQDAPDEDRVDIGGYGSFRLDAADGAKGQASFTMRRFVLTTDARVGDRFTVYSEVEYERLTEIEVERSVNQEAGGLVFEQELEGTNGSELALEQAWGQFEMSEAFAVRFGAVLAPVGRFNLAHDDNLWNLPRRPLADRAAAVLPAKAAWTEMGLGVVGSVYLGERARITYQGFLLGGTTLDFAIEEKIQTRDPKRNKLALEVVVSPTQGAFDGSNPADAFAGRIEMSPVLSTAFAVSGYVGRYTPEFLDNHQTLSTFGIDGRQQIGPFEIEGEFLYSHYDGMDQVFADFAEAAIDRATETESSETANLESEIEIEIGGLAKNRYGLWVDVSRPIALKPGTFGLVDATITPVVRYEHVWLDDNVDAFDFSGGVVTEFSKSAVEQRRLSVGIAFRPAPQGVFHLTYSRNDAVQGALIEPIDPSSDAVNMITLGLAVGF